MYFLYSKQLSRDKYIVASEYNIAIFASDIPCILQYSLQGAIYCNIAYIAIYCQYIVATIHCSLKLLSYENYDFFNGTISNGSANF